MNMQLTHQGFLILRKMHNYGGGFVGKTLFLEDLAKENSGTCGCGTRTLSASLDILLHLKFIEYYSARHGSNGSTKGYKLTKNGFEAVEMYKKWSGKNEA